MAAITAELRKRAPMIRSRAREEIEAPGKGKGDEGSICHEWNDVLCEEEMRGILCWGCEETFHARFQCACRELQVKGAGNMALPVLSGGQTFKYPGSALGPCSARDKGEERRQDCPGRAEQSQTHQGQTTKDTGSL